MSWRFNRFISDCLEFSPVLYVRVQKWRYRKKPNIAGKRIVSKTSTIMIEGFPRCSNSFAVRAFRFANDPDKQLKIATHLHSPAHIVLAIRYGVPALVLIRHPDEAVLSKLAKFIELAEPGGEFSADRLSRYPCKKTLPQN